MPLPILTAGIVTYRTDLAMLKATLDALQTCTLPLEAVIVDNSLDAEYFTALQRMSGIRCIRSPINGGYGAGHNLAMTQSAAAPYHLILNPDVVIHPRCLETLVGIMEEDRSIGLAVPKAYHTDGRLQALNKRDPTVLDLGLRWFTSKRKRLWAPVRRRLDRYVMLDQGYDRRCDVPCASGCFMLFRRSVLEAIGGFDERFFMYFEDMDISRRTRAIGRIHYCPEAEITHCWARDAYKNRRLMLALYTSAWQYFQKWGWQWW